MKKTQEILTNLIKHMGFSDVSVSYTDESRRFSIFINDAPFLIKLLPQFVSDLDFVAKMISKKHDDALVFVDVNNYRKEREELIIKLAKAAARKALATKESIILPPMNAYERRIVHTELAMNPDLKTESEGIGKERKIVIKHIV